MEDKNKLEKVKSLYNNRVGARDTLIIQNTRLIDEKAKHEDLIILCAKIVELLSNVSANAREKAREQLETIVTTALQYVSNDTYEFKIEPLNGKKPGYEFYVVDTINGIESKQIPEYACGGGFVDVIATALRYTYLNAFSNPVINNAMILDEPGKMVSKDASIKFAEFIKYLSDNFDRQTIMVTHKDDLLEVADKLYLVNKIDKVSAILELPKNINKQLGE